MRSFIRSLFIVVLLNTIANAEVDPSPSKYDDRIRFVRYNPDDVFNIYAKDGFITIIVLESDERVLSAGTGFSGGWDITTQDNIVHIRPKAYIAKYGENDQGNIVQFSDVVEPNAKDWKTNLFISTNKRTYIANLNLGNKKIYYKISFKYPREERIKKLKLEKIKREKIERENIKKDLNHLTVPRNWNYYMKVNKGSDDIKPDFVYDDGVFTYIGFKPYKSIPTVFLREGDNESILNTHIKRVGNYDVLVVRRLAKLLLLRSGNKLVGILNGAYGVNSYENRRETSNDSIKREIINE